MLANAALSGGNLLLRSHFRRRCPPPPTNHYWAINGRMMMTKGVEMGALFISLVIWKWLRRQLILVWELGILVWEGAMILGWTEFTPSIDQGMEKQEILSNMQLIAELKKSSNDQHTKKHLVRNATRCSTRGVSCKAYLSGWAEEGWLAGRRMVANGMFPEGENNTHLNSKTHSHLCKGMINISTHKPSLNFPPSTQNTSSSRMIYDTWTMSIRGN